MKRANLIVVSVFIAFIFILTAANLLKAPDAVSTAERRKLAQFPAFSIDRVLNGRFVEDYARFLRDQVAFRDRFRAVKAFVEINVLRKSENNGVYVVNGNLYDKFYGIQQSNIERAASLINAIIAEADGERVYLSIIPSKAHLLNPGQYLLSDQAEIAGYLKDHVTADYIDLMNVFQRASADVYYRTDHHWTTPGAIMGYKALISAMGDEPIEEYDFEPITASYMGSHYGKAAIDTIEKDTILLAHNELLDAMRVCRYTTATQYDCFDSIYFREKENDLDPYDVFLGGAGPLIVIKNDRSTNDAELVIFKDSYAHSLAPFLAQHFKTVTLVDLRYVRKELIFENFDLKGKTLLFLYSTTILNIDPKILN